MRKLIFVWFLISVSLLFVLGSVAVLWNGPIILQSVARYFASDLIALAVETALYEYENEGLEGFDRFLAKVNFRGHSVIRVLDENGKELKQRSLPPELEVAARRPIQLNQVVFNRGWMVTTAAYLARGPSGKEYRVLFLFPIADVLRELLSVPAWLLRIALLLAIVVAMCSWLSAHLSAPLRELLHVSQRFAGEDLKTRAGDRFEKAVPEIRELARGFDHMADRIELMLDRQKQLLQQLSHELRTPLTRLGLSVNMARSVAGDAAAPALRRIDLEAERLNALIERILRLSRLEAARDLAGLEPIDMSDFLESIVADAQFEAAARGRSVRLLHQEGGRMEGDRDLLRGALDNVLRNAIRFTPVGTEIEVSQSVVARPAGGAVIEVRIRDHGPGVVQEQLEAIFEPFVRVSSEGQPADNPGFGLGLSIVKRSLELHGGSVSARNVTGGGLELRILLPLKPSP